MILCPKSLELLCGMRIGDCGGHLALEVEGGIAMGHRMRVALRTTALLIVVVVMGGSWLAAAEPADVAFTSKFDQTEQRYVVVLPEAFDAAMSHSVLIALHGHGSDRWQFVRDGRDECRAARDAAVAEQMIFVSPDYRARTSWMGPAAEADLLQILDELRGKYRIARVVLSGGSMGGTGALTFAALHPQHIDGVVSMNGTANLVEYDQFQEAIAASFGGSKQDRPDEYRKRSAELNAARLSMPIALTTGGLDRLVPPDSVQRLAAGLAKRDRRVRLIHRPETGHETKYADAMEAFAFVFTQMKAAPPLVEFGASPIKIVCLGDSVTGVYYHTGGRRAYPEMLELALRNVAPHANVQVINAGISGHTATDGLARLDRDVLKHEPQLVSISFGLNDMARVTEEQFVQNLTLLVERCRAAKSLVVFCTPNAVINTSSRPVEKLIRYCELIHQTGRVLNVPVCDQFAAGERHRARDAWGWRTTLSDEIHPNMDGHRLMAEQLCRTITGRDASLDDVGPPRDFLDKTTGLLKEGRAVRVLAMPPFDTLIGPALKQLHPNATVEVTPWPTGGKSLVELEQVAKTLVRPMKPDLVVLAIPASATAASDEEFLRAYSWVMNWSLSFGHQEWECVVVHPTVAEPDVAMPRSELIRQLVRAQDLTLIDRPEGDRSSAESLFVKGLGRSR